MAERRTVAANVEGSRPFAHPVCFVIGENMLKTKEDTHLLFYNVFGTAAIAADKLTIQLNLHKDGRLQGRTLSRELDTPLLNVSKPILLAFGAWVQENEIYFTPGKLEGYDAEAYEINKTTIDEIINSALALVKGAVSK